MNKQQIEKEVIRLSKDQEWNHQYFLPHGVSTRDVDVKSPGYNINKWARLAPIFDEIVKNKVSTVLDVGCSDGFYCIRLGKRYKSLSIKGIDLDDIRIERSNFVKSLVESSNCDFEVLDLYDLMKKKIKYDVVMGLGLLHRVSDLEQCLSDLCSLSNQFVIFEFKSLKEEEDCDFIDFGGATKTNSLNGLYKVPSVRYVQDRLEKYGFKVQSVDIDKSSSLKYPRTILVGKNEQSI